MEFTGAAARQQSPLHCAVLNVRTRLLCNDADGKSFGATCANVRSFRNLFRNTMSVDYTVLQIAPSDVARTSAHRSEVPYKYDAHQIASSNDVEHYAGTGA